jgi:hypothetical protein
MNEIELLRDIIKKDNEEIEKLKKIILELQYGEVLE